MTTYYHEATANDPLFLADTLNVSYTELSQVANGLFRGSITFGEDSHDVHELFLEVAQDATESSPLPIQIFTDEGPQEYILYLNDQDMPVLEIQTNSQGYSGKLVVDETNGQLTLLFSGVDSYYHEKILTHFRLVTTQIENGRSGFDSELYYFYTQKPSGRATGILQIPEIDKPTMHRNLEALISFAGREGNFVRLRSYDISEDYCSISSGGDFVVIEWRNSTTPLKSDGFVIISRTANGSFKVMVHGIAQNDLDQVYDDLRNVMKHVKSVQTQAGEE